jgi:type I restriction enzyme R subunit
MSAFNEANTVEAYVRDLLAGPLKTVPANVAQEPQASYVTSPKGVGWRYKAPADVPRQIQEVLVESWLRDALIRLNPEISAQPDRAD